MEALIRSTLQRRSNVMALALRKHLMAVQGLQPISRDQLTRPCAAPEMGSCKSPTSLTTASNENKSDPMACKMRWPPRPGPSWRCVTSFGTPSCYVSGDSRRRCDVVSTCRSKPGRWTVETPAHMTTSAVHSRHWSRLHAVLGCSGVGDSNARIAAYCQMEDLSCTAQSFGGLAQKMGLADARVAVLYN